MFAETPIIVSRNRDMVIMAGFRLIGGAVFLLALAVVFGLAVTVR